MDQISRIYYPVFLPLGVWGLDRELDEMLPDIKIIFYKVWGSPVTMADKRPHYRSRYTCMSCQEATGEYWYTDEFIQEKLIPASVEDQMTEHVEQHIKLGAWGISIYKRWRKK